MKTLGTVVVVIGAIALVGAQADSTAPGTGATMRDRVKENTIGATNDATDVLANGLANAAGLIATLRESWAAIGIKVEPTPPATTPPQSGTQIYPAK